MSRAGIQAVNKQLFRYFLILDFEATCLKDKKIEPQEIIEFPMIKVDATTLQITSSFHRYVKPVHHPEIPHFCTELTGITQDNVKDADTFPQVFSDAKDWIASEMQEGMFAPVLFGDTDLQLMLPEQCGLFSLEVPPYFRRWINLKKTFADNTGVYPRGLKDMLSRLALRHIGRHHSGYDDCVNIANIAREMCRRGFILKYTT